MRRLVGRVAVASLARRARPRVVLAAPFAKKAAKIARQQKKKQQQEPQVAAEDEDEQDEEEDEEERAEEEEDIMGSAYEKKLQGRMQEVRERLSGQFARMRGATPTPELFEVARVDAYGSQQPLSAVAQVTVVSNTLVECHCFDPDLAPRVQEALANLEGLSLNPRVVEGGKLTIPFPRPSAEARDVIARAAAKAAEKAKAKVRQLRQRARDQVKKIAKTIAEEDLRRRNTWIDALSDDTNKALAALLDKKKSQIRASGGADDN